MVLGRGGHHPPPGPAGLFLYPGGGGYSPIFVHGCAISEFETPPFDEANQRWKFDPFIRQIREKNGQKWPKMYDSEDLQKILALNSAKHAFLRGETSILSRKGPFCKALLRLKRDPFARQNLKSRPLWKAKSSKIHPGEWHTRVYRV